jgi:hypothetical protein
VCSFELKASDSVASESLARTGELSATLLSYSSSASDSGYAVPDSKAMLIGEASVKRCDGTELVVRSRR